MKSMMRILSNAKTKALFGWVLGFIALFALIAAAAVGFHLPHALLYVIAASVTMGIFILGAMYRYFKQQEKIMEQAVGQITAYLSGNRDARIACDEEGELYRLFHEINALAAILNAHAENEQNAKRFLRDTIANISHQLKTPLAALNIYNGILQEETKDFPTIQEFVMLSEQELDRMESLVQNLLKIAKLDAGTIVLEKAVENVSEMMRCVERHFAYRAKQEEKALLLSGEEAMTLLCDRNWFLEAVNNLVKNAFDHTKVGNCIHIEWRQFGGIVQIAVKDNGSGIHPEDLPHLFKRFYRSQFSQDTPGVGLGLALSKAIIEAHNGTIEVNSELRMGTTFTINFLIPTKL